MNLARLVRAHVPMIVIGLAVIGMIGGGVWYYQTHLPSRPLSPEEITAITTQAQTDYTAGKYAEAIAGYQRIIASDSNNKKGYGLSAYLEVGHMYRYWGKYKESEAMFAKAEALAPDNPWVYTELGKLYRNSHNYTKAEAMFKKSLELNPNQDVVYSYGLGYLYRDEGRFDEAEAAFKKALELNPTSDFALMGLGDLARDRGQYAESEAYFKQSLALNAKNESYLGMGWLYINMGRYDEAITALNSFLTLIREKGEVYYALGQAYKGKGDLEGARKAFARAVELNPDNKGFTAALAELR